MDKIDERYKRGKIYTIRCRYDNDLIYVGSTIQPLSKRIGLHRIAKNCSLYQYVNGDWNNWYIELYEEYPCNNKNILEKREGEVIRLIGTINKQIAGRTFKEYYEDNKDKILEQKKTYYQNNRENVLEQSKQHYQNNREKKFEYDKQYRQDNRDKILEKKKQYHQDNREKVLEKNKEQITCDKCGCKITKNSLQRHKKTKKCLNYNVGNN